MADNHFFMTDLYYVCFYKIRYVYTFIYITSVLYKLGHPGRLTVIGAESEIVELGSNSDRVRYVHFCTNALGEGRNTFLL